MTQAGARARTRYGKQLERRKKNEEAAEQSSIAIQSNPDYYLARKSLAFVLAKLGRRAEGLEILREVARRNPALEQVKKDIRRLQNSSTPPEDAPEGDE